MNSSSDTIVNQYYAEMQQTLKTGKLNYSKLLFADDAILIVPGEKYTGHAALKPLYNQFTSVIENFEIKQQIVNDNSASTLIEHKTKLSPIKVEMTEWINIRNGKIAEFRVYFDTVAWNKATKRSP